ncbi:hypothetical protein [Endozoicomonas ascidiicola]|uniref:hypothetical protein n=1 Tax=Endozoicomonas ascidiicola TaxID=1698521 RepID=UPI000833AF48|nr:hypothetical protein [Endozoicomonas ascidiicola]
MDKISAPQSPSQQPLHPTNQNQAASTSTVQSSIPPKPDATAFSGTALNERNAKQSSSTIHIQLPDVVEHLDDNQSPPPYPEKCNIPEYNNEFPLQEKMSGKFISITDDNELQNLLEHAKVSQSVFNPLGSENKPSKLGHDSQGFKDAWLEMASNTTKRNLGITDTNRHGFNGKQLCVYYSLNCSAQPDTKPIMKLIPSDYYSQAIARSRNAEGDVSTVRTAYNCGSIMISVTSDEQIVYGHRNGKPMFPAGFILGNREQVTDASIEPILEDICKGSTFKELAQKTALSERREEVYDDNTRKNWEHTEIKPLALIGEKIIWPSKQPSTNHQKDVFIVKSTVFFERLPVSSKELQDLRKENLPIDHHELGDLHFLNTEQLNDVQLGKSFIAEHAECFNVLNDYFNNKRA